MFSYEKDNGKTLVFASDESKLAPTIELAFKNGVPAVIVDGCKLSVGLAGGMVGLKDAITLNGKVTSFPNPDLVMEAKEDGYHLTGKIALIDPQVAKDLGWAPNKNLFVAKITFEGDIDPKTFSGSWEGTGGMIVYIKYDDFSGPNFIYQLFDGKDTEVTIKYKASTSAQEKTIKIFNDAVLEK